MAILQIPVVKGGGIVEIDEETLPNDVYREALIQGLKVLVNRGASKITKTAIPNDDDRKAAAMKVANEQVELIKTSKIKFTGKKATAKASGAVMTEARRLAKNLVKDEMKRQNIKISHVAASDITKAANAILEGEQGKGIIAQAEQNLKDREAVKITSVDIGSLIKADPALVAKAEARKAKEKAEKPLSATQAGKPAVRQKGKPAQAQA